MWSWPSHLSFPVFSCLTCKRRNFQSNGWYSLSWLSWSRINNHHRFLKACSLLLILSAWSHFILPRIPGGWSDYPCERKLRLRKFRDCHVQGASGPSRTWTWVCGTPSPGCQCCSLRKNVRAKPPGAFSLEKLLSWKIRPTSSQSGVCCVFSLPSVTMLQPHRQEAGQASWSTRQLSQSQIFTIDFSILP